MHIFIHILDILNISLAMYWVEGVCTRLISEYYKKYTHTIYIHILSIYSIYITYYQ